MKAIHWIIKICVELFKKLFKPKEKRGNAGDFSMEWEVQIRNPFFSQLTLGSLAFFISQNQ